MAPTIPSPHPLQMCAFSFNKNQSKYHSEGRKMAYTRKSHKVRLIIVKLLETPYKSQNVILQGLKKYFYSKF